MVSVPSGPLPKCWEGQTDPAGPGTSICTVVPRCLVCEDVVNADGKEDPLVGDSGGRAHREKLRTRSEFYPWKPRSLPPLSYLLDWRLSGK